MSDANKGLSGRKRRVGAMRGLISLAVIFFVALSAQAFSKTTIECKVNEVGYETEKGDWIPQPQASYPTYTITFEEDAGSIEKYKVLDHTTGCFELVFDDEGTSNEIALFLYCFRKCNIRRHEGCVPRPSDLYAEEANFSWIGINRRDGRFQNTVLLFDRVTERTGNRLKKWKGFCEKVEKKF